MSTLGRQWPCYVDFGTVPMTQSSHTRSCFHRVCFINVSCRKSTLGRQLPCYVDFSTVPMTQSCHTRSCFYRVCFINVSCKKRQLWVDSCRVMLILVPFPWPKCLILSHVFIVYVPSTYAIRNVNFGSTVAVLCWFWYRSHDPKFSY